MKKKKSLLLGGLMLFAFAMVLTVGKPVQAKKVTQYVETSSKEYRYYIGKMKLAWKSSTKYDKAGHVIENSSTDYYNSKKGKTNKYKYVYKKDLLQKSTVNGKLDVKYSYDKKGNLITSKQYDKGKYRSTTTYSYKKGKLASAVTKEGKRVTSEWTCYSNGNLKSRTIFWEDGSKLVQEYKRSGAYTEMQYDSQNRVISEGSYDSKGSGFTTDYRYDQDGNKTKSNYSTCKYTYKKGVMATSTYTSESYGDNGEVSYSNKTVNEYYTSGYRSGWPKTEQRTESDGTVTGTNYSYKKDSSGKNVAVQIGKDMTSKTTIFKITYTYKKITTTVK